MQVSTTHGKKMLDIANQRFLHEKINNVKLQHGDVCKLTYENERFDAVLSMNGFHAFPTQKHKAFSETYRVLKQSSSIWVLTNSE
ncbi:MAG: class I SAM-dependent methyltransferase [Fermentimonas sp.]|jgi:ubiquinone/menaquinone biosynthesis C-methylase UbiE